jgi:hypothetical protein
MADDNASLLDLGRPQDAPGAPQGDASTPPATGGQGDAFDAPRPPPGGPPPGSTPPPPAAPAARPEFIEEKFWDPATGQPRVKELAQSYRELQKQFSRGEHKPPANPAGYRLEAPPEAAHLVGSQGGEDPVSGWFREFAHKEGWSQDQAQRVYSGYLGMLSQAVGPPVDPRAELQKLGPNGQGLVESLYMKGRQWVEHGVLSEDDFEEYKLMAGTAAGIKVMHKILAHMGDQPIPNLPYMGEQTVTPQDLDALYHERVKDGPYAGKRRYEIDASFRAKIDAMYERLYGTEPQGRPAVFGG